MDAIIFLLAGILIGGSTAFLINYFFDKKGNGDNAAAKRKIFDTLLKLKADIESKS